MSVYKSFTSAADHVASWKAGGPRYAKVDGWTIDAIQAWRDIDARATEELRETLEGPGMFTKARGWPARSEVERASALAVDPVQAVRCGVPAVIENPRETRLFLRRLVPVHGVPRMLVCGVLTGADAIDGPDEQLAIDESGAVSQVIRAIRRGEAELAPVHDGDAPTSTRGMSYETVMADLGRARIKP